MLPRQLIPIIAVAAVFFIALFGYTTRGPFVHVLLIGVPILLIMINHIGLLFGLMLALLRSNLVIPGLPQGFMLVDLATLMLVAVMIGQHTITKKRIVTWDLSHRFVIGLLIVVGITMLVRDTGIKYLGGNLWGGAAYIKLILYALLYLTCGQLPLSETLLRRSLIALILFSLIPVLAQVVFYLSGGSVWQQYTFIKAYAHGMLGTLEALESGDLAARLYFQGFGFTLMLGALIFFPYRSRKRLLLLVSLALSLAIFALSGFRSTLISFMATVLLFTLLVSPGKRVMILASLGIAGALVLLALTPFIPNLPSGVQRAFSWVPFYDIPHAITVDANVSVLWRFGIWDMAMAELPRYLLVGKGFAFDGQALQSYMVMRDSQLYMFIAHNYHSGPLSLLLDLGAGGFVTATGFMLCVLGYGYRGYLGMRQYAPPFLFRAYCALYAYLVYAILAFYLIYGDARSTLMEIFLFAGILQILRSQYGRPAAPGNPSAELSP